MHLYVKGFTMWLIVLALNFSSLGLGATMKADTVLFKFLFLQVIPILDAHCTLKNHLVSIKQNKQPPIRPNRLLASYFIELEQVY